MKPKPTHPDRIIAAPERRELIPYCDAHVLRLEKQGRFPKRLRLGARRVGWRLSEILEWIEARAAERGTQPRVAA